jgi:hypothetical protein
MMTSSRTPRAGPSTVSPVAPSRGLRIAAALLVSAAACQEPATSPSHSAAPGALDVAASASTRPPESADRQRQDVLATELARGIANALAEPALRNTVMHAMQSARFAEHKLSLRSFLASPKGARLASAVDGKLAQPGMRLTELLDSLPAVEVYLPVREHRAKWRGGKELIVASGLHEGEAPHGFALDGTPVTLDATTPPKQPVLILTQSETDFAHPLDASGWQNVEDAGGAAIGTLVRLTARPVATPIHSFSTGGSPGVSLMMVVPVDNCDPSVMVCDGCDPTAIVCDPPPPPPPPPSYPVRQPGIWLDRVDVNDVEEPWYRGSPEVQLTLTGPAMNGFEGARLSCSGQYAQTQNQSDRDQKYFDQGGNSWARSPYALEGLLFGQADFNQFGAIYQNNVPVSIELWEDDTGGENCNYNGGGSDEQAFVNDIGRIYGVASQVIRILRPTIGMSPVTIGISLAMSIRALMGGDDLLLGRAVNVRLNDGTFSQQEFRLVRPSSFFGLYRGVEDNGRILVSIVQPPVT